MKITSELQGTELIAKVQGRLETTSAPMMEAFCKENLPNITSFVLDFTELEYVSSVGLRVILSAQKTMNKQGELLIRGANPMVMEIFEVTGFVDILNIELPKQYKEIVLDETKKIGQGGNGAVYQYQEDSIVKLYFSSGALEEIEVEKKFAREALILGIPTAISLGIVKVGEKFGLEYEFIKSKSLSGEITAHPERTKELTQQFVELCKLLHTTSHQTGKKESIFQPVKEVYKAGVRACRFMTPEQSELCCQILDSIAERDTIIHGDFHTGNVMVSGEELLLIDMADISYGHPIFDLAETYLCMILLKDLFGFKNPEDQAVIGLTCGKSQEVWDLFIDAYLSDVQSPEEKAKIIDQIAIMSLVKLSTLGGLGNVRLPESFAKRVSVMVDEQLIPNMSKLMNNVNW